MYWAAAPVDPVVAAVGSVSQRALSRRNGLFWGSRAMPGSGRCVLPATDGSKWEAVKTSTSVLFSIDRFVGAFQ